MYAIRSYYAPDLDNGKYPSKEELITELENQHDKIKQLLRSIGEEKLNEPLKWRFSNFMPTLGDVVTFMCVNHEAT